MENEFKENVTYYANKLRYEGLTLGDAISVRPDAQSFTLQIKVLVMTRDFYVKLEKAFMEATEWTGKDPYWYIQYMNTTKSLEITISFL